MVWCWEATAWKYDLIDLMSSNKPSTALLGILFTSSDYSFDGEGAG